MRWPRTGKEPPAFLSDHPTSEQRIADIKRELPEAKAAFVAHSSASISIRRDPDVPRW
jgi:predicted Zn-dependent protease